MNHIQQMLFIAHDLMNFICLGLLRVQNGIMELPPTRPRCDFKMQRKSLFAFNRMQAAEFTPTDRFIAYCQYSQCFSQSRQVAPSYQKYHLHYLFQPNSIGLCVSEAQNFEKENYFTRLICNSGS